jgi:lysophospholipase L1-like esterase
VLEALPIGSNTAAVFVYLGVNDAQPVWLYPHERGASGLTSVPFGVADWDAVYARRTRDFLDRICQRGARRAVVLLPVDVNRPDMQRRLDRIRELQVRAASTTSCAVVISTAGDQGTFEAEGSPKRMPDGFHMSARGAQIVWERIEPQVARLFETEPQDS